MGTRRRGAFIRSQQAQREAAAQSVPFSCLSLLVINREGLSRSGSLLLQCGMLISSADNCSMATVWGRRIQHPKGKETKLQAGKLGGRL